MAALMVLAVGLLLPGDRADEVLATTTETAAAPAPEIAAPPPPAPRATVHRYRVWQWNVAGNTLHHGSVSDGLISATVASIVGSSSQVATVNELCRQQFEALQAALAAAGWPQGTT